MFYLFCLLDALLAGLYLLLFPILLLQGAYSRDRVITLPEPPGPREGSVGSGAALKLLILGDSAGAGVGAPTQRLGLLGQLLTNLHRYYTVDWKIWAETGKTTLDTIDTLRNSGSEEFDVVVVSLGVNDITELVPAVRWIEMQEELITILTQKFRARQIFLASLPPMSNFPLLPQPLRFCLGIRAKLFTRILRWRFLTNPRVRIIRLDQPFARDLMAMDGFHPGPPVYELWARQISEQIVPS